jgi:ATP-dependent Clp protease ATP-binding subunit ClpA
MFNRFTKGAKEVVVAAEEQARSLGSSSIEAEHLLLAYAAAAPRPALDRERLLSALEADFESSLRAAGVSEETIAAAPPPSPTGKPGFGTSSKAALENAFRAAKERGDRRIEARHVALGVLAARRGTVPRALQAAGLEIDELREKV